MIDRDDAQILALWSIRLAGLIVVLLALSVSVAVALRLFVWLSGI